jgi:hypothetical protein
MAMECLAMNKKSMLYLSTAAFVITVLLVVIFSIPPKVANPRLLTRANMEAIAYFMSDYASTHNDTLPSLESGELLQSSLTDYHLNMAYFIDPASKRQYTCNQHYSRARLRDIRNRRDTALMYQSHATQDGKRYVLFATFDQREVTAAEWANIKIVSRIDH